MRILLAVLAAFLIAPAAYAADPCASVTTLTAKNSWACLQQLNGKLDKLLSAPVVVPPVVTPPVVNPPSASPLAVATDLYVPADTGVALNVKTTAQVIFRLRAALPRQVAWECSTVNGNTYAPEFFPGGTFRLEFRPGETQKALAVPVNHLGDGQFFYVGCSHSQNQPPNGAYVSAKIIGSATPILVSANPVASVTPAPVDPTAGLVLAWTSTFTEPMAPIAAAGQWGTRPDFGLIIGNNESGVMVDKTTHPWVDNHPVRSGRHVLRAQRMTQPVTITNGGASRAYTFAGSYLTGIRMPSSYITYGYIELQAGIARKQGSVPAFWLMPAAGGWPPEIDIFENGLGDANALDSTVHGGNWGAEGLRLPVIPANDNSSHRYGLRITPQWHITYIDGVETNRRINPFPGVEFFPIFNVTVGGLAPDPVNPPADWESTMTLERYQVWR